MKFAWRAGVAHLVIGGFILFLTMHPLKEALDVNALGLVRVGGAWQALNGLVLMIAAVATRARLAAIAIALGAALAMAMLYFIIFTGLRPAIIVLVPIGRTIATLGWASLAFAAISLRKD